MNEDYLEYLHTDEGKELIGILIDAHTPTNEYHCILIHSDECINDGKCNECSYGVTEEEFEESYNDYKKKWEF